MSKCYKKAKIQRYLIRCFPFSYEWLYSFDTPSVSDSLVESNFSQKRALPFEKVDF